MPTDDAARADAISCSESDVDLGAVHQIASLLQRCIGTLAYDVDLAGVARIIGDHDAALREENEKWQDTSLQFQTERDESRAENERLREALVEIGKGEGRFSVDHKQHAINTIEDMKALADAALAATEVTP